MGSEGNHSSGGDKGKKGLMHKAKRKSAISPISTDSGIDFVLVTALPEERDAVLDKLTGYRQLSPVRDNIRTYYQAELPVTFPDNSTGKYRLIVTCLLGMGRIQAVTATADAIRRWRPRYIILVGIAGGITTRNIKIGDILISDQIVDYELQKLTPQGPEIRWEVQRADSRLLEACNNYRDEMWQETIQIKRPDKGKPRRYTGPIASGDKVIAFSEVLARYRDVWTKLIGVEMEAAGVATAAFQSSDRPGFFMVRGVSDLADENKGSSNVEKWRSYACAIAASFTIDFLKSGPIPLAEEPLQENAKQVEIILNGEFRDFIFDRRQDVIMVLAALLSIDPKNIRVLRTYAGSIVVVIEIPGSAANRLHELATKRDFRIMNLGIKSVWVEDREVIELTDKKAVVLSNRTQQVSSSVGAQNGARTRRANISRRATAQRSIKPEVLVAFITGIATIFVALLNFPPFIAQFQPSPTPTFTHISSQTPFFVNTATPLFTGTPYLTDLPLFTDTPVVTITPTETPTIQPSPAPVLVASLVADRTTGRSPLIVKFDARDSFLRESTGMQLSCRAGACYYTWKVFFNLQQIGKSVNNSSGKFEYTFRERGTYTVTVYICRGQDRVDCKDSAIWIEVTR